MPGSLNYNNIFANTATYELWNDNPHGSADVNAENNWWGTAVESEIQAKIYDWFDDATKGIVDYSPFATAIRTDAPISPPTGLTATAGTDSITLSWSANPESDLAGYKVYWDTDSGHPYANMVDVGNVTSYTIPGLTPGTYYVTVTAYDINYDPANDDPDTIVNENQTNGNESWFAIEQEVYGSLPDIDVQPPSWDYGSVNVGSTSDKSFTVQNTGTATLNVSGTTLVGTDAGQFAILSGGGAFSLAPGTSRTVTVRFAPTSAGAKSATLRFTSDDPDENLKDVPLSGTGVETCPATAALEGTPQQEAKLGVLYAFRDKVLANTPMGQRYITLFYKHAVKGVWLMVRHPDLRARTRALLERYLPTLQAILAGRPATMTHTDLAAIKALLQAFAAKASPQLQADLKAMQEELQQGAVLEQLGIRIQARRLTPRR